jgi:hypothetical protein
LTLFPYTTLFRSPWDERDVAQIQIQLTLADDDVTGVRNKSHGGNLQRCDIRRIDPHFEVAGTQARLDLLRQGDARSGKSQEVFPIEDPPSHLDQATGVYVDVW